MSPTRITSSGASALRQVAEDQVVGGRRRSSRSCGPHEAARSARAGPGYPHARASAATVLRPAPGRAGAPRGSRPRVQSATSSANAPISSSLGLGGGRAAPPSAACRRRGPRGRAGSSPSRRPAPGRAPAARSAGRSGAPGPGGAPARLGDRPHRRRAIVEQPRVVRPRDAQLAEPAHRRPVQLQLVDRLAGAAAAQLGRAVGRDHDQRHARLARLGDGRVEVRARRAGRRQHDRRAARSAARCRARRSRRSARRRGSRPGSRARCHSASASGAERDPGDTQACSTPGPRELLDERRGKRGVAVRGVHAGRNASRARSAGSRARPRRSRPRGPGRPGGGGCPSATAHSRAAIVSANSRDVARPCAKPAVRRSPAPRARRPRSRPARRARSRGRPAALGDRACAARGPPTFASFTVAASQTRAAAARVLRRHDALVGRQRHVGARPQRRHLLERRDRLLGQLQRAPSPRGARRPRRRTSCRWRRRGSAPAARARPAPRVTCSTSPSMPTFSLKVSKPRAAQSARAARATVVRVARRPASRCTAPARAAVAPSSRQTGTSDSLADQVQAAPSRPRRAPAARTRPRRARGPRGRRRAARPTSCGRRSARAPRRSARAASPPRSASGAASPSPSAPLGAQPHQRELALARAARGRSRTARGTAARTAPPRTPRCAHRSRSRQQQPGGQQQEKSASSAPAARQRRVQRRPVGARRDRAHQRRHERRRQQGDEQLRARPRRSQSRPRSRTAA